MHNQFGPANGLFSLIAGVSLCRRFAPLLQCNNAVPRRWGASVRRSSVTLRLRLGEARQWPSFSSLRQQPLLRAACRSRLALALAPHSVSRVFPLVPSGRSFLSRGAARVCLRRCEPTESLAPGPWGSNTPALVSTPALHIKHFIGTVFLRTWTIFWDQTDFTCFVCVLIKNEIKKLNCVCGGTDRRKNGTPEDYALLVAAVLFECSRCCQWWVHFYSYVGFNCARAPVYMLGCVVYYISRVHLITLRTCTWVYPLG